MKNTMRLKALMMSLGLLALSGCDQNAQKVQDLEKQNTDLSASLAAEQEKVAAAEQNAGSVADLSKQLEVAKAEAKSLVNEITEINTRVADAENALAALQTKSAGALEDLASVQAELKEATKEAMISRARQKAYELAAEDGSATIKALKQQVADLTAQLATLKPGLPEGGLPSTP